MVIAFQCFTWRPFFFVIMQFRIFLFKSSKNLMALGFVHRWLFDLFISALFDTAREVFFQMFSRRGAESAKDLYIVHIKTVFYKKHLLRSLRSWRLCESQFLLLYLLILAGRGFGRRVCNDSGLG